MKAAFKSLAPKCAVLLKVLKAPFEICKWSENLLFSDVVEVSFGGVTVYPLNIVNNTLIVFAW